MGKNREKKKKKKLEKKRRAQANRKPAKRPERIDIDMIELEAILDRAKASLTEEEYKKIHAALETLLFLTKELGKKRVAIKRLKDLLFGASTEKTKKVLEGILDAPEEESKASPAERADEEKRKKKGHGRNGAEAYTGAEKIKVPHESLKEGDACPECGKGTLYRWTPGWIVNVTARAPLNAKVYEIEKLRCKLCGTIFTARTPEGVKDEKYDAESAAMIALLKYGSGLPFNRLDRLQGSLGIPLPASTQWDVVERVAGLLRDAHEELIRQAAQGKVLHNDDTTMKILGLSESDFERLHGF